MPSTTQVRYVSTRGTQDDPSSQPKTFKDILLSGTAPNGGLYVPDNWPHIDNTWLSRVSGLSYADLATQLIQPFVGNDIPAEDLSRIIDETYGIGNTRFSHSAITPLHQIGPNVWLLELFHGPSFSFKDIALQLLGRLFDYVLKQNNKRITILGATSGDTGSAAIEGCKNRDNIDIVILHPYERTSEIQRRQMTTVDASNVHNIAIKGNFDDCQNMVKAIFADSHSRDRLNLTSINSINWMRIAAQMVYYAAASIALGAPSRAISFAVPTGNFGNVYSAYSMRHIGLPIEQLIIANNSNSCVTQFVQDGKMHSGNVVSTLSPSMDIQIPSNFERYLYDIAGHDSKFITRLMTDLKDKKSLKIDDTRVKQVHKDFKAHSITDDQTLEMIATCHSTTGIVIDPHTAVGLYAAQKSLYDPETPLVSLACAHPAKFPVTVQRAIGKKPDMPEALQALMDKTEHYDVMEASVEKLKDFLHNK